MSNYLTLQPGVWIKVFKNVYREEYLLLGYGRIERVVDVEYERYHLLNYKITEEKIGQLMPPYLIIKLLLDSTFSFNLNVHHCSSTDIELMSAGELERVEEKIERNKRFLTRLGAMPIPEFSSIGLCSLCFLRTVNDNEHFENIRSFINTGKTITEILKWMKGMNYSQYLYFMIPHSNLATDAYEYWILHFKNKNYQIKNKRFIYSDIVVVEW